jgi:glutamate-1-semialdehyde 2,1-aminomutase
MTTRSATIAAGRSAALLERASASIPGGINTAKRKIDPPLCVANAAGGWIEDLDGNRYLDYHCAFSAILLGHAEPAINVAVAKALDGGTLYGVGVTDAEVRLAEKLVSHVSSVEQVVLCNTGTEATYHAIRLSRGVTGRQKIVKFQGCYDGYHDYVLRNVLSKPDMVGKRDPGSRGMLEAAIDNTLVCRFNDLDDVRATLEANRDEVAAIIVEPIAHNAPTIMPEPGFLPGLRELCDEHGAIFICDEVITGFRHGLNGYQAIAGVTPDLTTMGKAMANGYAVAALGGRRELMERFTTTPHGDVLFGGTYNANAVGVAAALATIELLEDPHVYEHLFALGKRMRDGLTEVAARVGVPAYVSGFGSVFVMLFMDGPLRSYEDCLRNDVELFLAYRLELRKRGVFEMPENVGRSHVMYRHTVEDVDRTLELAEQALTAAVSQVRA